MSPFTLLLAALAGYVDTAGFLALHGLFTTHVTGNFVTLGASLVYGTSGTLTKLLALPLFCVVIASVRVCGGVLAPRAGNEPRIFLGVQSVLLAVAAGLAVWHGPFPNGDDVFALVTGLVLVTAMAIQNAMYRIHLPSAPPSTFMTGSTTQFVIDLVDLMRSIPTEQKAAARQRAARLGGSLGAFAVGCAGAAIFFLLLRSWCFVVPPLLGMASMFFARE